MTRKPKKPVVKQENLVFLTTAYIFSAICYCHETHTLADMKSEGYFESMASQMKAPGMITLCDKDQNYEQCAIKMVEGKIYLQTFHFGKALQIEDSDKVQLNQNKYSEIVTHGDK